MLRVLGYFVSNVIVLLLFNFFPNVEIRLVPAILFVFFLTLLNRTVIPVIKFFALPINFLTFGLVNGLINLAVLLVMLNAFKGIDINAGFGQKVLLAILLIIGFGIGNWIVNQLIHDED